MKKPPFLRSTNRCVMVSSPSKRPSMTRPAKNSKKIVTRKIRVRNQAMKTIT